LLHLCISSLCQTFFSFWYIPHRSSFSKQNIKAKFQRIRLPYWGIKCRCRYEFVSLAFNTRINCTTSTMTLSTAGQPANIVIAINPPVLQRGLAPCHNRILLSIRLSTSPFFIFSHIARSYRSITCLFHTILRHETADRFLLLSRIQMSHITGR